MSELSADETVTPDISRKYQIPISQERLHRYQEQVSLTWLGLFPRLIFEKRVVFVFACSKLSRLSIHRSKMFDLLPLVANRKLEFRKNLKSPFNAKTVPNFVVDGFWA